MHLRYDKPFNGLLLVASVVFVGLFLALTLADSVAYQPDLRPAGADSPVVQSADLVQLTKHRSELSPSPWL